MLETTQWVDQYFDTSVDAIMIFKDDTLVISNAAAKELRDALHFEPHYLIEVANANAQQKFSELDNCFNCAIQHGMKDISIPITFAKESPHPLRFFMVYKVVDADQKVFSITLKNRGVIDRMDQLARQRRLNEYVNQAHEDERKQISQDLHDSIAQGVYSAIMGIRRIANSKTMDEETRKQMSLAIETQLSETLNEVKGMALDIRPSVLDNFGLLAAIKALAKRLEENTGITIHIIGRDVPETLKDTIASTLYRITQESINNALKHANPTEISVLLVAHDHFIILEVMDNGDGFVTRDHQGFNGHSLGLMNMNERVKALNGVFNLKSIPGDGTTVTVKIPVA